jgi:hypothetical protein
MKLVTVLAAAGGLMAAPVIAAGVASGLPPASCDGDDCMQLPAASCDGAGCVPGVPKNAALGAPCVGAPRYSFGLDATGKTFMCSSRNQWVPTKPLVGVRPLGAPCNGEVDKGSAQSPDGLPMTCQGLGWNQDYTDFFYSKTY